MPHALFSSGTMQGPLVLHENTASWAPEKSLYSMMGFSRPHRISTHVTIYTYRLRTIVLNGEFFAPLERGVMGWAFPPSSLAN
jgi:hypothetical protein